LVKHLCEMMGDFQFGEWLMLIGLKEGNNQQYGSKFGTPQCLY